MAKKNKKKSTFFSDFKAFITKGNIMDMAVGVVIGGAFSAIVNSLVNDIIMPLLTLATGDGVQGLSVVLNGVDKYLADDYQFLDYSLVRVYGFAYNHEYQKSKRNACR